MVVTTTKIHTNYFDFLPKFRKEAEVFENEKLTGWKIQGGLRRGNKKVEESWPYHSSDPAMEMAYKLFMDKVLDKTGKNFKTIMDKTKTLIIKKLTDGSPCCVCAGIPCEILYKLEDITRIERYCENCIKKVYSRVQVL
jgi:hypothetical protein